jgi:gluconate 2-dehydrogenase alpha chain
VRDPDVLVIGMGAAGARAATVLAASGLRVVAVEAGGWVPGDADRAAAIGREGDPSIGADWFTATLPWVRRTADELAAPPAEPAPMVNAVGGSNHRSARQSYRLDLDATPARWPLTTAELLPYYERVEETVRAKPTPPAPWTETMRAAATDLGWDTVAAPVATAPPIGRDDLRPLIESGHLEVLTDTVALGLVCDDSGAVVGAEVLRSALEADGGARPGEETGPVSSATGSTTPRLSADADPAAPRDGRRERIRARRVVLAAHTFENVRLLLLSRSPAHPDGVGNSTGQVGHGFATHNLLLVHGHFPGQDLARHLGASGHAVAVIDFDREDAAAAPSGGGVSDPRGVDPLGGGFRGGSILQAAMGAPDPDRIAAATGLPPALAHEVGSVWAQPEQLARATNRLDLDPARRDPVGRPLLVATQDLDAEDLARADFLLARMEQWLRAAGASRTWRSPVRPNALGTHAYGGTVMGADPATSVVNSFGEVHDAPGLFVLGASTFPGTGGRGPTETVEALAWRTADRILAELGR